VVRANDVLGSAAAGQDWSRPPDRARLEPVVDDSDDDILGIASTKTKLILIAAYPKSLEPASGRAPLQDLYAQISGLPRGCHLHLLPFAPSSGDFGFALSDWFSVDPELGSEDDVKRLTALIPTALDGVYNHVGRSHPWSTAFLESGAGADRLWVLSERPRYEVRSPRGGSVFRRYAMRGRMWWLWQTFGPSAIDIRLDNPVVVRAIQHHIKYVADLGAWALRLDSVAYLGKRLGEAARHHPLAAFYAQMISGFARDAQLAVLPQLNCDRHAYNYVGSGRSEQSPVMDFGFTAQLLHAVHSERTRALVDHITRLSNMRLRVVHVLRTHDGIPIRPVAIDRSTREAVQAELSSHGITARLVDGRPDEFTSSLPFLLGLGTDDRGMWRRLELSVALASLLPNGAYIYLPVLFGFRAEIDAPPAHSGDPRAQNRVPMPREFVGRAQTSPPHRRVLRLLHLALEVRRSSGSLQRRPPFRVDTLGPHALIAHDPWPGVSLAVNFATQKTAQIPDSLGRPILCDDDTDGKTIAPTGFAVWWRDTRHF
jgi:sucrose phosphorylase